MKHIFFLLSFSFCLVSLLQAQNPYVELSYPWLNQQQVKAQKIKSIMLATMSADNSKVEKQTMLHFDIAGRLVKETGQVGFVYSASFDFDDAGFLSKYVFNDGKTEEIIQYRYFPEERKFIRQSAVKTTFNTWDVSETEYIYNEFNRITVINEYGGIISTVDLPGNNSLGRSAETQVSRTEKQTTIKSQDGLLTLTYNKDGQLQLMQNENFAYNISETYEYSYDQNGRLVMIIWSQEGQSNKTFVTYEFYQ